MPTDSSGALPAPIFPQHPELLTPDPWPGDGQRHWTPRQIYRVARSWAFPYFKSLPGDFHPIIAYLFTEMKCNLDCNYCWSYNNQVKGMTEETARASIDWLRRTTCRALALMGGEVLLRPDVIDRLADAGDATFNLAVDAVDEKPGLPKALTPIRRYFDYQGIRGNVD